MSSVACTIHWIFLFHLLSGMFDTLSYQTKYRVKKLRNILDKLWKCQIIFAYNIRAVFFHRVWKEMSNFNAYKQYLIYSSLQLFSTTSVKKVFSMSAILHIPAIA